jgi:hypothetical protein
MSAPWLYAIYYALAPCSLSLKQRSWILTAISSITITCTSLPLLADFLASGGSVTSVHTDAQLAYYINRFFQQYLVL